MKLRYYLRGLGTGIIVTALILSRLTGTGRPLTDAEIRELLVLDVKDDSYFRDRGVNNQHGGGGLFAYDEEIMGWLFGDH